MSEKFALVVYKERVVAAAQGRHECKQFSSRWSLLQLHLRFAWFNDHFLLLILASVATNHKTTNESDLVEQYCWSIKVRSWQNWWWARGKIAINETEYLSTCEYGPHYIKMVHTMAPRSNFALAFPINIQLS